MRIRRSNMLKTGIIGKKKELSIFGDPYLFLFIEFMQSSNVLIPSVYPVTHQGFNLDFISE